MICLYSLKNPSFPEYKTHPSPSRFPFLHLSVFDVDLSSKIRIAAFCASTFTQNTRLSSPSVTMTVYVLLLIVHCLHACECVVIGTVAVYDVKQSCKEPQYKCDARSGQHLDPVWEVSVSFDSAYVRVHCVWDGRAFVYRFASRRLTPDVRLSTIC